MVCYGNPFPDISVRIVSFRTIGVRIIAGSLYIDEYETIKIPNNKILNNTLKANYRIDNSLI